MFKEIEKEIKEKRNKEVIYKAQKQFQNAMKNNFAEQAFFSPKVFDFKYGESHNLNLIWTAQILDYLGNNYLRDLGKSNPFKKIKC